MSKKSILIASDLSERSDRALQRGFSLAASLDAKVTVITVVDDSFPAELAVELVEKSRNHHEATAANLGKGVECQIDVERGDPVTRLVEMVNTSEFDLVVVGRHRKRGLLDGLRRTTVEGIISQSLKPVLMVIEPVHGGYRRVLAPVAFSAACHRALRKAYLLAPDATFRIYHAWIAPFEGITGGKGSDYARVVERETLEQAQTWATGLPSPLPKVDLVHDSVVSSFHREIEKFSPDLLTVGANTRSVSFAGLGSFTAELLRDPPTDLLVTRGVVN